MGELVVDIKQGHLRGSIVESITGGSYITFKGIPYAAPPVGNLRFANPQPLQPWLGVRDAIAEGSKCAQMDFSTQKVCGDEDCLYLNVATMSLTGSRPVMIWFHGGAFVYGDGGFQMLSPDALVESGIVHVSVNYRLGVLGFLNLDDETAPGNAGLKDQVAALKWVKENIAQFGGDPKNVTIFGASAGGASVHYHLLSPLSKGLFHKAIMQSGVVLNPFAAVGGKPVDTARRYVAALGREITDPKEIAEYLRTLPVEQLIKVQSSMATPEQERFLEFPFGPSVDDKSPEPFVPRSRDELAADGFAIPVMIGYNSHDGLLLLLGVGDEAYKNLDKNFETAVPQYLAMKAPSKVAEVAQQIRKFYFGDKPITKDLRDEYVQCFGDIHFVTGIHKVVEIQREKKALTYFYKFSYDDSESWIKKLLPSVKGTGHGDENHYIFTPTHLRGQPQTDPESVENLVRSRFVRIWTDFAKTGNPTPLIDDLIKVKWEPVTKTTKNYLEIGAELSAGVNPDQAVWEVWQRIYDIIGYQ